MEPERRTQAARSATTRAELEDAAIDVLVERGWAAVTTVEVCSRAGVTRGAFHHHYASVPGLVADALRRLYAEMSESGTTTVTDLSSLLDRTWSATGDPRFKAVIEAWLAMSNHPELREEIGPVVAEFASLVHPGRLSGSILGDDDRRAFYTLARETMLGLALGRATNGGRPLGHEADVLARLHREAAELDRSLPASTRRRT